MGRAGAGKLDFRLEQGAFGVQHVQIRGIAVVIAQAGQIRCLAQTVHRVVQRSHHIHGTILDGQRVAHFLKCLLDSQHIACGGFALSCFAGLHIAGNAPEGQDRQIDASADVPDICGALEQVVKLAALRAELAGQGDGREPFRPGRADFEVCRLELGFRRDEIRAAFQQVGRHAHGQLRRAGHGVQFESPLRRGLENIARGAAGQHHEGAFRRGYLILRRVQAGPHAVHFRLGPQEVQFADQPFIETGAVDLQSLLAGGQRPFGNGELGIIAAQADIGRSGLPGQAEHHAALSGFRGQQLFARGGGGVAHPAPQIHFPHGLEAEGEGVVDAIRGLRGDMMHAEQFADGCARRDVAFRHSGASGTAGTGKGGKVIGSGQPQIGPGLIHAGDGRRKILVMQQRFFHQLVQHGIIEAFPPLDFKTPCRHGQTVGSLAPCFGDVHRRAVVVRGEGTAGQCHARDQAERRARAPECSTSHVSSPHQPAWPPEFCVLPPSRRRT